MRNYKLDMYKGIAAVAVIWIHIGTFVGMNDTIFLNLTRILTSLAVPLFFIISGYFLQKSRNPWNGTKSLWIKYTVMSAIIVLFELLVPNLMIVPKPLNILPSAYLGLQNLSIGFLWFIAMLVRFRILICLVKKVKIKDFDIYFVIGLIILSTLLKSVMTFHLYESYMFIGTGYLISAYSIDKKIRVSNLYIIAVVLAYALFANEYNTVSYLTYVASVIVFMTAFNNPDFKPKFSFYARNSLNILFLHYFVLQIFLFSTPNKAHFILNFIIVLSVVTLLLYGYEQIIKMTKQAANG